jgi:hypothetical protein
VPVAVTEKVATAGAITVTLTGCVVMLGATPAGAVVTVIVIGLDIVDTPLASVALAVKVKLPVVALVQLAVYGDVLDVASKLDPL